MAVNINSYDEKNSKMKLGEEPLEWKLLIHKEKKRQ